MAVERAARLRHEVATRVSSLTPRARDDQAVSRRRPAAARPVRRRASYDGARAGAPSSAADRRAGLVGGADDPRLGPQGGAQQRRDDPVAGADERAGQSRRGPGPSRCSSAAETPPAMTTTSGSKAATRLATPTPSQSPTDGERLERDPVALVGGLGDHRADQPGRVAVAEVVEEGRAPGPSCARACRARALPLQYCSQQPVPPHSQAWPSGTTCMWPNSPAIPLLPRCTRPLSTTAPPMPVPRVTTIASVAPRAAPKATSARAAQLASLSRTTVVPQRSISRARTCSPRQGRCGANITRSPAPSTKPAAARPTPSIARRPATSWTASVRASSTTDRVDEATRGRAVRGAQHLDRARRRPRPSPWCRRRRRR